jgi:hypothetical protein
VFVQVAASPGRLLEEAEDLEYCLMLDETEVRRRVANGGGATWSPLVYDDVEGRPPIQPHVFYRPFQYMYGPFVADRWHRDTEGRPAPSLYTEHRHPRDGKVETSIFRAVDRKRLVLSILHRPASRAAPGKPLGCNLHIEGLARSPTSDVQQFFCLHNEVKRRQMEREWAACFPRLASMKRGGGGSAGGGDWGGESQRGDGDGGDGDGGGGKGGGCCCGRRLVCTWGGHTDENGESITRLKVRLIGCVCETGKSCIQKNTHTHTYLCLLSLSVYVYISVYASVSL